MSTHEGKKELVLFIPPTTLQGIDWDAAGAGMADLLDENLVDKDLKNWIIPSFSSTTMVDKTVSAMLMMASMKSYFEYTFMMLCGIPSVTLQGTKQDWIDIQTRLLKLDSWDDKTRAWHGMLKPVIGKFIAAFDGEVDTDFWGHIAHPQFMGSGAHTLGGWITAFCAFTEKGKFNGNAHVIGGTRTRPERRYELEGVAYPVIDKADIPAGSAEVDIKIIDPVGVTFESVLIAGNMGMRVTGEEDTVQNVPMWCCCLKAEKVTGGVRDRYDGMVIMQ